MGCDYYTELYMCVRLKNSDESYNFLLRKDSGYWSFSYDSDSEDGFKRAKNEERTMIIKSLPNDKVLFENEEWKISSEDKKKKYLYHLTKNSITLNDVDMIVKTYNFQER